uniref:Uncharacterized protein n=1 Tax=Arundo donax TaxID=35708 RepID=A0A0A9AAC9_ARUDO
MSQMTVAGNQCIPRDNIPLQFGQVKYFACIIKIFTPSIHAD